MRTTLSSTGRSSKRLVCDLQLTGLDLREIQHIVDQGEQVLGTIGDHSELLLLLLVQGPGQLLQEDPREPDDGVERACELSVTWWRGTLT